MPTADHLEGVIEGLEIAMKLCCKRQLSDDGREQIRMVITEIKKKLLDDYQRSD
jgi:hypothetical protein